MRMRLGMIGLGKLGLPCAEVMAAHHDVDGFDVLPVRPANVQMVDDLAALCADKDVIFVAVPTPHEAAYGGETPTGHLPPRDFAYDAVTTVLRDLNRHTRRDQVVALISTVLPGTTRRQLAPLVRSYRLLYNPYLIAAGTVKWDMMNPEMVIIGTDDGSATTDARRLIDAYRPLLRNDPRIVVGTWEEAESIKIFYNTFISAKVGLVNMIQDVAERIGYVDVDIVTDALRDSTRRIMGPGYMRAGMGDGGPCHPRDNIALRWLAERLDLGYDLFGAVMSSRERQAQNLARKLVTLADGYGLERIWIHGKTYKPHVPLTSGSYSVLVAHYVEQMGRAVRFIDPLTGDNPGSVHGVVLLAHDTAAGRAIDSPTMPQPFYCTFGRGSVIVDPWRRIPAAALPQCVVVHYGNSRERPTDTTDATSPAVTLPQLFTKADVDRVVPT